MAIGSAPLNEPSPAPPGQRLRITLFEPEIEALLDPSQAMVRLGGGFRFTEGPVWDQRDEVLLFHDIRSDSAWRWTAAEGMTLVRRPNLIGNGQVLDRSGARIVCEHVTSSVVRMLPSGARELMAWNYQGKYLNSPNDVVVRSDGTVFFTDPDYGRWDHAVGVARKRELGFQGVFRVARAGEVELAVREDLFDQPNGLAFSPDERILYIDDRDGITAFDVGEDGTLSYPRPLLRGMRPTDDGLGGPDGMKVDAAGNVWCTGPGGVWIVSPDGKVLGVVQTPETVANIAWGGADLRTLFLCTSTSVHAIRTRVPSALLPYHQTTHPHLTGRAGAEQTGGRPPMADADRSED